MANVYIEEFPIDKNIVETFYISSILYIDNEYYFLQYDKLYKIDIITGAISVVKKLDKIAGSNMVYYNRKIYYCYSISSKGFNIAYYDIDTGENKTLYIKTNNDYFDHSVLYNYLDFRSISLENDNLILIQSANTGDAQIIKYNLINNTTEIIALETGLGAEFATVTPSKYINEPNFDFGSTYYHSDSSQRKWGGYRHLTTQIERIFSSNQGTRPWASYHSMIKEYDGHYLVNGSKFDTESSGIYYFKDYSSEPKKVLDLDATYVNGYVDQISEGQYVLLGTEKVAIIHIEPYKNTYTIKDEKGKETYGEINQAPNMNKALLSIIGNEKALKLTGINNENYSIKWTSFTPADKVFLGLSVAPNSSAPLIPVGKEVSVSFNDSTILYEVYGKYKPLSTRFEIHTYKSSAEQNRVDKTNFLTADMIITGVLREASSLIHPSITFTSDTIPTFNYVYIPIFNRYYYVTDITSIKNKLWQMSLTADVLMTYKEALLACTGYIDRNENDYNGLIPDGMISLQKGEVIETNFVTNEVFTESEGTYILQGLLVSVGDVVTDTHTGSSGDEHSGGGGNFGN